MLLAEKKVRIMLIDNISLLLCKHVFCKQFFSASYILGTVLHTVWGKQTSKAICNAV